ncbi:uncharacterized protein EV422DRAFT_551031 [Fimicolochytrium jonesii]|uniref:uncharacterized protein n=1 Tax=Fimicolochytrium jonesii TaxID=1396493 RepID=UPI0022FF0298|nr:uncharacterized protein EV422DRAFT_551031 [Fimicolochytrium jonesii]KAI8819430.1 hypothetical protein EV422DRAFT_551031 [Fimicolochytrium jonesii]
MSAQDFLTFIGSMRDEMSHLRIVRDSLPNRYMVLIKFRSREAADVFVQEYNGREYSSLEPETCHVVYIKSVEFKSHAIPPYAFPPMPNDPSTLFLPNRLTIGSDASTKQAPGGMSMAPEETPDEHSPLRSSKSPVGPGLLELPTCPVCLDRMDASVSGLLTIVCHHTFHCHCLAKWGDSSCPVCRYSSRFSAAGQDPEDDMSNECMDCGSTDNLWICLICGNIGCGRYQEGHAQEHFTDTQHLYALELETQRVWDYAGDGYVHRLIQNRTDGKLVELPAPSRPGRIDGTDTSGGYEMNSLSTDGMSFRSNGGGGGFGAGGPGEPGNRKNGLTAENGITAEKMESIGLEYTYLLTSQLESQRTWYQQQLTKLESSLMDQIAAVMAALTQAQKDRDVAVTTAEQISEQLSRVEKDNRALQTRLAKLLTRALASEKEAREEKAVSASLLENQAAYQAKLALRDQALEEKEGEAGELREQVRDLMAFLDMRSQVENSGMGEGGSTSCTGAGTAAAPASLISGFAGGSSCDELKGSDEGS